MNFHNSHLIKLKVDAFTKTKFTLFWVFAAVVLGFVFMTARIIPGEETIRINEIDCPDDRATEFNLCSRWELSNNRRYNSFVPGISSQSKYLLVQAEPSLKGDTIQGEGNFDLKFNFDYSYTKIPKKKSA